LLCSWGIKGKMEHLTQFFVYSNLPPHLQEVSKPFCDLAEHVVRTLPANAERDEALRKLLEAKDCAVRANLCKPSTTVEASGTTFSRETVRALIEQINEAVADGVTLRCRDS